MAPTHQVFVTGSTLPYWLVTIETVLLLVIVNTNTNADSGIMHFILRWLDTHKNHIQKTHTIGTPGWLSGWASAFGSGHDLRIWDRVPHWAPRGDPASPSACVSASLSRVSHE